MYFYIKAFHIIFVVTWFSGLFYIVRLFIYATEANQKAEPERSILVNQFQIMMRRLWYGITWPSAILTLVFGVYTLFKGNWNIVLFDAAGRWLLVKLVFVLFLYAYHLYIHKLFKQEQKNQFSISSQQLRIWNEVATIFLVAIVMLATVKQALSFVWGLVGIIGFAIILMGAIKVYKKMRK
ncbi:MAG TPA: CopD family protein [Flavisolibacter sp.]|nr:CopD family protein [Flavisolibacter sp.]